MLLTAALHYLNTLQAKPSGQPNTWFRVDLTSGARSALCVSTNPDALQTACVDAQHAGLVLSTPAPSVGRGLEARVCLMITRAALKPTRLELRITADELSHVGIDELLALSILRDSGVGIAMTQATHLAIPILDRLPLTAIVLDEAATAGIPHDATAVAGIRALAAATSARGLTLVGTAIETEARRALLCGLGCDLGEGGLFGSA